MGRRLMLTDITNKKPIATWPYNLFEYCNFDIDGPLNDDQYKGFNIAITTLTEREQGVLFDYFQHGNTLEEIGNKYGVGRERIRQIIAKACRKLRHPDKFNYIRYGATYHDINNQIRELEIKKRELQALKEDIEELEAFEKEHKETADALIKRAFPNPKERIHALDLSVRSYNCLKRAGIDLISEIPPLFRSGEIKKLRNLGVKSFEEIHNKLLECGYAPEELIEEQDE